jgi:radical SAM superfamily enzyme YgiQ (UPF0313 family)
MRILLVTPNDRHEGFEYVYSGRENLGVEYLLASLRAHDYEVLSRNENIFGEAAKKVDWESFDLIGFSLPFWEYRDKYVEAINEVAEKTEATLIAGGHASTLGAKYFLAKCPELLGIVMGEGEETLCELVRYMENGGDPRAVAGLMSRGVYQPRSDLKPLDSLPFPARDELRLSLASGTIVKEALVESTRGCTYHCSFCSIPPYYKHAHGKRWRERSVENICEELTQLITEFPDVDLISFTDDNFLGFNSSFHNRAIQIARHIHSLKPEITFEIVCRVDAVELEPFRELASLGLIGVYLGIESGVQRVLDSFRKRTTVEQNLRAIQILSELGIGCDVGFITFSPGMTITEVRQNLDFLKLITEDYPIFVHPAAVFRCLREYPKDLGEAALRENATDSLSQLNGPVQALYEALDALWHERFETEFIRCEGLAATRNNDSQLLDRQKAITIEMLQLAFTLQREVERHCDMTSRDLLAGRVRGDGGGME